MDLHLANSASLSHPPTHLSLFAPHLIARTFTSSRPPTITDTYQTQVPKCSLLAFTAVWDVDLKLRLPYVALATRRKKSHHVLLYRLLPSGFDAVAKYSLQARIVHAVILRGAVVVLLADGRVMHASQREVVEGMGEAQGRFLCAVESDLEAVVADVVDGKLALRLVRHSGEIRDGTVINVGVDAEAMAVSFRKKVVLVCASTGVVHAFATNGGELWRAKVEPRIASGVRMSFWERGGVVVNAEGDIWMVGLDGKVALMFKEECGRGKHEHLYVPWRDKMLQCELKSGSCCTEKEMSWREVEMGGGVMDVTKRLERRLEMGVNKVMAVAEKREMKEKMLKHVRGVLDGGGGRIFDDLESIVTVPERRGEIEEFNGELEEAKERFVRVLRVDCGVDESARFVVVKVHMALVEEVGVALKMEFNRAVAAIWDVERRENVSIGESIWLRACAPISAIVTQGAGLLHRLELVVGVEATDGRVQNVTRAALVDVLSKPMGDVMKDGGLLSFQQRVQGVAQGTLAHNLKQLESGQVIDGMHVESRENLACFDFCVASSTELALAVARLRAAVDDDVRIRSCPTLSTDCLSGTDSALRALDGEMSAVRDIAAKRSAVGYEAEQIDKLLKMQIQVDDAFGLLEEQYIGT